MLPLVKRVLLGCLAPVVFVYQLLNRIFWSGLNERTVFSLPLNFFLNFSPVFIWLLIFKNAGLIPKKIRPPIHVSLAHKVETFVFDVWSEPLSSLLSLLVISAGAWVLYTKIYAKGMQGGPQKASYELQRQTSPTGSLDSAEGSIQSEGSSFLSEEDFEMVDYEAPKTSIGVGVFSLTAVPNDFQDHPRIGVLPFLPKLTQHDISEGAKATNKKLQRFIQKHNCARPFGSWPLTPPALLAASWLLLNLDASFATPITETKDTISWFSYVIGHFCVPLFTAIWLYVFHAPGALKCFSFALGAQNIAGVLTHLVFPNAPPWFIHKFGDDAEANYDTLGYAAGLTRAKFSTGTHLVNNGFHKSPIVFGAVPSLHSAMAVMCFFFVCYYSRWIFAKALLFAFVVLQWWATIYLDHHWRIDLLMGLLYAIASYTVFAKWLMPRYDHEFASARLRYDFKKGSTMGMRVFRNTRLQSFFDPMA